MDGCTVCAMVAPLSLGVNWDVDGWHARNAGEVNSQHGISNKKEKNKKQHKRVRGCSVFTVSTVRRMQAK